MSLRVCPIAPVYAPMERVWSVLSKPANFALWWDGKTRSIEPEGEAQPGQRIHAQSALFGIPWNVDLLVERVDPAAHTLDVMTSMALGIIIFTHISCTKLDQSSSQLSFGCEFSFSSIWWGWVLERFASQYLYRGVASALLRLKTYAEKAN
jgi:hypothetical protein